MKLKKNLYHLILTITILAVFFSAWSCSSIKKTWDNANLFPVSQDIELGKQVYDEILANPSEYPIVPEKGNEQIYSYVRGIVSKLLATGNVSYARDFAWKISIINDPKVQNAFATPGGYIFLYTGLMKFLDSEDQLAGVLGHEMAHAAKRHSTRQLTKILGVQVLADAVLGKKETVKQVATAIVGLSFSRDNETEADSFSVKYLCPTPYNASGAAGFFKKIAGQATPPEWMSTHPNPSNRIKNIESKAKALNCKGTQTYTSQYQTIKTLIDNIPPAPKVQSTKVNPTGSNNKPSGSGNTKTDDPMNKNKPGTSGTSGTPGKVIKKN